MTVMVALLRGVNVGGTTRVPMADLRRVVTDAGYGDVRTYVNSGNVVLTTDGTDTDAVAATLQAACARAFPAAPDVLVRTREELHGVVAANPFLDRDDDPTHHHVVFLPGRGPARVPDVEVTAPEDLAAAGREVYLYLPHGMGRSELADRLARDARRTGARGTARNWRTVTALVALADALG